MALPPNPTPTFVDKETVIEADWANYVNNSLNTLDVDLDQAEANIVNIQNDITNLQTDKADLAGATFTGDVVVPSLNGGQLAGMRNKIINGKMEIAQRGTSFSAIVTGAYSLDRWRFTSVSSAVITASQESDVPSGNEFQSSLRHTVTTADTSIATGDQVTVQQVIEGFNVRDLIGRTFTLSFWVRSSKTGVHCISFINSGADRTYVLEYTINSVNTWEKKTLTVVGGLITAGTWNWTNGVGLRVCWPLASGTTFQTTAESWQTGGFFSTANQVNCLDTIGNIFAITGVQLEAGPVATPFEHRLYGQERDLCLRYFERGAARNRFDGAIGGGGGVSMGTWIGFKQTKRATPSMTTDSIVTSGPISGGDPIEITADGFILRSSIDNSGTIVSRTLVATFNANAEL